ncbi:hypothetical protein RCL1_006845 [Eukaryota sp. TZLM3-RCL]
MSLSECVALITGASSGIGRSCAIALAREMCTVVLTGRNRDRLSKTADECRLVAEEGKLSLHIGDLNDPEFVTTMISTVKQTFGKLNFVIAAAGVSHRTNALSEIPQGRIEEMISTNLVSTMNLVQQCIPLLRQSPNPRNIIVIGSQSGRHPRKEMYAYCASKHGIVGFTESLFEDVREEDIRVTNINPGLVATPMITNPQLERSKMIPPEDVANLIVLMAKWPGVSCITNIDIRPQKSPYQ